MLGAIIGDIVGSRFEFDNHRSKFFEFFSAESYFTDDTVMTLAIAKAIMITWKQLIDEENTDEIYARSPLDHPDFYDVLAQNTIKSMQTFGHEYPNMSYGMNFRTWIFADNPQPYNSFGNGSAMRVSPVAYIARGEKELLKLAETVTAVTHNHPEGIKGAQATAIAIYKALRDEPIDEINSFITQNYYPLDFTLDEIRSTYQFNETCQGTVPQALQSFFESDSFEDTIRTAVSIGGDSDTLAAITGSIAEAYYSIPPKLANKALSYLDEKLLGIYNEWLTFLLTDIKIGLVLTSHFKKQNLFFSLLPVEKTGLKHVMISSDIFYHATDDNVGRLHESFVLDDEESTIMMVKEGWENIEYIQQIRVTKNLDPIILGFEKLLSSPNWIDRPIPPFRFFQPYFQISASYENNKIITHQCYFNRTELPMREWYELVSLIRNFLREVTSFGILSDIHLVRGIKPGEIKLWHVVFQEGGSEYQYQTTDPKITPGHYVLVPVGEDNQERVAEVNVIEFIEYGKEPPYPLELTKHIIRRVFKDEVDQLRAREESDVHEQSDSSVKDPKPHKLDDSPS